MNDSEIKKNIEKDIKENTNAFPFIAQFWEIEVTKINSVDNKAPTLSFGHYETNSNVSISFFKPISKIIDFNKIKNE